MSSVAHIIRRRRRRKKMKTKKHADQQNWSLFAGILILLLIMGPATLLGTIVVSAVVRAQDMLPEPRTTIFRDPVIGATEIYDADGQTLLFSVRDPLGDERTWIELDDLPEVLIDATLVAEDPDFRDTVSFDPIQLASDL